MAVLRRKAQTLVRAGFRGSLAASHRPLTPQLCARLSTVVDHPRVPTTPNLPPGAPAEAITADAEIGIKRQENARRVLRGAAEATAPRHDWTKEEIAAIYYQPLMELSYQAVRTPDRTTLFTPHLPVQAEQYRPY